MVTIDNIKASLDSNKALTPDVKRNIFELVIVFNQNFPNIDLTNLNNRLMTLVIKRESKYLVKMPCKYVPTTNEIMINKEKLEKSDYVRHILMHQLLQIITAKDNYCGFNDSNNTLVNLNEGYTEILTNFLVGDMKDNPLIGDIVVTNMISEIISNDELYNSYFNNNSNSVLNKIKEKKITDVINDYERQSTRAKEEGKVSTFENVQKYLIELNKALEQYAFPESLLAPQSYKEPEEPEKSIGRSK